MLADMKLNLARDYDIIIRVLYLSGKFPLPGLVKNHIILLSFPSTFLLFGNFISAPVSSFICSRVYCFFPTK